MRYLQPIILKNVPFTFICFICLFYPRTSTGEWAQLRMRSRSDTPWRKYIMHNTHYIIQSNISRYSCPVYTHTLAPHAWTTPRSEKISGRVVRQEMVAQTGNAYSETVLNSVHSPKGYVKQASATVAPPGYIQPKHRYKVSTVDAMMKHLVHKHDISVNEAGFNGVSVEILQQAAIVHGGQFPCVLAPSHMRKRCCSLSSRARWVTAAPLQITLPYWRTDL